MLDENRIEPQTVEELLSRLEHIDESELQSDIRANVCAELRRIKRNVSAVLLFIDQSRLPDDPELRHLAGRVRRECLTLNGLISRTLLLYGLRVIGRKLCADATSRAMAHYREMAEATCRMCSFVAPTYAESMARAL